MRLIIFFLSLILYVVYWDLRLHFAAAVNLRYARKLIDRKDSNIARMLFAFAKAYGGISLETSFAGRETLPETFLIISNHQSIIDIAAIFYSFPNRRPRFVAKEELAKGVPMISAILQVEKHAIIKRHGNFTKTMKELQRLAVMSRKGYSPVIFPEGTRSKDGEVKSLHPGAVRKILETTPMPVLAVALDGGYKLAKLKSFRKNLQSATYRIKFLHLYPAPAGKKEVLHMLSTIQKGIKDQVDTWHRQDRQ